MRFRILMLLAAGMARPVPAQGPCDFGKLSQHEAPLVSPRGLLHNPLKEAVAAGKVVYGNTQHAHDLPTSKTLADGGHFVWMQLGDGKGGTFNADQLEAIVSATHPARPAITVVQLDRWDSTQIKPLVGEAILGVAAPLETPEDAATFLSSVKFPPEGFRGLGPDDTDRFLADVPALDREGNHAQMAIAVIDSPAAASEETLRRILSVQLKGSEGTIEKFDAVKPDPSRLSATEVACVEKVAAELGLPLVGDAAGREQALAMARRGYRMLNYGNDLQHIRNAMSTYLASSASADQNAADAFRAAEAVPRAATGGNDNPLYDSLNAGKLAVGFYSMGHDPQTTKVGTERGMSFFWADGEHRPLTPKKLRLMRRAARDNPVVGLVRVPHQREADAAEEEKTVRDYVRAGASALVQPNVGTAAEAEAFIGMVERAVKDSGREPKAVVKAVMIETAEGLKNVDAILDVVARHKDTMWVHIGPYDLLKSLKGAYKNPDLDFKSKEFINAEALIERKARERGIALGGLALDRKGAAAKYAKGYRLLTVGSDQEGINAGINRFLQSAPHDPSPLDRSKR